MKRLSDALPTCRVGVDPADKILTAEQVSLRFGGVHALEGVSFDVGSDELLAVIGPNGAGKTSLFNCISGVYRPQHGDIRFLGQDVARAKPHKVASLGVARMFQNVALFENLTIVDNIMSGRHHHFRYGVVRAMFRSPLTRKQEAQHREVVEAIIDFLEIESYRALPVGMLPLGIQKRVELGRALAMEPKLLLLDEPVAGMNREETEDMARFVLDIREDLGIPMVLVEHDMGVVMDLADRVLVLNFGQRIAFGTPDQVQSDPEVIRAYLGESVAEGSS